MSNRRPAFYFFLGAVSMWLMVLAVLYVAQRWFPARGVTVAAAPSPQGPASPVAAAPPADTAPSASPSTLPAVDSAPPAPVPVVGPRPGDQPVAADGRLLVPVQGVRPEQLADTYTAARSQGRSHDAIDIMAPRGRPVLAAAAGVVLKLFQSVRGGTALYELAPDQRTIYYYAHLDRYADGMAEGRALRQGDVIGYVGDTGNAGAGNYHLHFEISTTTDPRRYWAGTPLNPYPLLRAGISRP